MRIKNLKEKILEEFKVQYEKKHYLKLILYCILAFLILFTVIALNYYVFQKIFSFLYEKFDIIAVIICMYLISIKAIKYKFDEKKEKINRDENEKENNVLAIQQDLLENNYKIAGNVVFDILNEYHEILKVKCPVKTSEILSPSPIIERGNFHILQYLIAKNGENTPLMLKQVFQERLNQKLRSHEIQGLSQDFVVYKGLSYPILNIFDIKDYDEYYAIEIVFGSKNYFNYLRMQKQILIEKTENKNFNLEDEDF